MWTSLLLYLVILLSAGVKALFGFYLFPEKIFKTVDEDGNEDDSNKWKWYVGAGILIVADAIILLLFMLYQAGIGVDAVKRKLKEGADSAGSKIRSGMDAVRRPIFGKLEKLPQSGP
tara:strand:+ start:3351 stop:3701 length:351 start_codon:yes stop_codon:yes gene_type:complete